MGELFSLSKNQYLYFINITLLKVIMVLSYWINYLGPPPQNQYFLSNHM